jgi:hypothetical protein
VGKLGLLAVVVRTNRRYRFCDKSTDYCARQRTLSLATKSTSIDVHATLVRSFMCATDAEDGSEGWHFISPS